MIIPFKNLIKHIWDHHKTTTKPKGDLDLVSPIWSGIRLFKKKNSLKIATSLRKSIDFSNFFKIL